MGQEIPVSAPSHPSKNDNPVPPNKRRKFNDEAFRHEKLKLLFEASDGFNSCVASDAPT